jgi:hypothetical protein
LVVWCVNVKCIFGWDWTLELDIAGLVVCRPRICQNDRPSSIKLVLIALRWLLQGILGGVQRNDFVRIWSTI